MKNKTHGKSASGAPARKNECSKDDESTSDLVEHVIENPEVLTRVLDEPRVQSIVLQRFQGPVPPPSLLREYESLVPGLANRLVELTEKEQAHRHQREDKYLKGSYSISSRGQWMAFVIVLVIIATAVFFGVRGDTTLAAILIGIDMVAICSVFIAGKFLGDKEDSGSDEEK